MWLAGVDKYGYGWFAFQGTTVKAHRFSYFLAHPEWDLKEKKVVCHTCDTPGCVNPQHLWLGTHAENIRDRDLKGRTATGDRSGARTCPSSLARGDANGSRTKPENLHRGEQFAHAKLTENDVRKIRKDKRTQDEIALDYCVAQSVISNVKLRKTWKHVR